MKTVQEILNQDDFSKEDIISLLSINKGNDLSLMKTKAREVAEEYVGSKVYLRGLIEFSNICTCDCYYCGIRKSNRNVQRYILSKKEILRLSIECIENEFGSLVLQSGERKDQEFVNFVSETVKSIKQNSRSEILPRGLGVTLSIGEQSKENYKKLFDSGAHMYLLRIESSNRNLFETLHPGSQSWEKRVQCLEYIKEVGFQAGTGILIGVPGQTIEHLADDILFFKKYDIDMIGMGPFIVHMNTPMAKFKNSWDKQRKLIFDLSLRMIAVTRIVLKDVNIASTTALQTIYTNGKEKGINFGANVIMPLLTPERVREDYKLYEEKPLTDDFSLGNKHNLEERLKKIGRIAAFNEWGDSPHFSQKIK